LEKPGAYAQEIADQKDILRIFTNCYDVVQKSVSGQQLPQILASSNDRVKVPDILMRQIATICGGGRH
jgi:hypothetical protein